MRKAGLGNIAALINKDIGQTFQKSKRKFVDINDEVDWIEKTKHAMTLHLGSIKSCSFPFDIHPWVLHLLTLLSLIQGAEQDDDAVVEEDVGGKAAGDKAAVQEDVDGKAAIEEDVEEVGELQDVAFVRTAGEQDSLGEGVKLGKGGEGDEAVVQGVKQTTSNGNCSWKSSRCDPACVSVSVGGDGSRAHRSDWGQTGDIWIDQRQCPPNNLVPPHVS
ncbi:hypothetical protein LWI29_005207 [Acer saccharum]|uniref:Uncharacterized protein n=1 Tax=Acer saccharum TaxID=4024 RepID=A0AA39RQ57_ACESA|nr:hypothetical protein LWI29_005207 [Acer saccharum]